MYEDIEKEWCCNGTVERAITTAEINFLSILAHRLVYVPQINQGNFGNTFEIAKVKDFAPAAEQNIRSLGRDGFLWCLEDNNEYTYEIAMDASATEALANAIGCPAALLSPLAMSLDKNAQFATPEEIDQIRIWMDQHGFNSKFAASGSKAKATNTTAVVSKLSYTREEAEAERAKIDRMLEAGTMKVKSARAFRAHITRRTQKAA